MVDPQHIMSWLTADFQLAMANPKISDEEKKYLAVAFQEAANESPAPRWVSNPGPQAAAYVSDADHLFFGGSSGPGKSALLLGLGLTAHKKSLILRLEGTNLTELKDQLKNQTVDGDRWKNIGHGGEFRTYDGRLIEMLGCDDEKRASALQGRPHDLLGFDELPQFSENVFRRLTAWLRTTEKGQRTRVVGAGNPPLRAEEEWIISYWAPWLDSQHPAFPAVPGELRWFVRIDGDEVEVESGDPITVNYKGKPDIIYPKSRTFIPATLEDNPDLNNPDYRASLALLPEPMRSQLLYGDMQIGKSDHENQLIPTAWVMRSMKQEWKPDGWKGMRLTAAGLDVAEGGDDNSALIKRYSQWFSPIRLWPGKTMTDAAKLTDAVILMLEDIRIPLMLDILATPGGSAYQAFKLKYPKLRVLPVNFGAGSTFRDKSGRLEMANLRAEGYFRIREGLDPNLGTSETRLKLPLDMELAAELCSVRWVPENGKVRLEKKAEIKKRLGRSPDRADAVALAMIADRPPDGGWLTPKTVTVPEGRPFEYGGSGGGFMGR